MQEPKSAGQPLRMGYMNAMRAESDRGAVLVAAAYIDEELADVIRAFLVNDPKIADRLFEYPGPLSTLSARCDVAYLLGLFGKDFYSDIRTIIKIRNNFAHTKGGATFEREDITDLCKNLTRGMREAGCDMDSIKPRNLFLMSAGSIILALIGAKERTSHLSVGPSSKEMPRPEINPLGY